MTDLQRFDPLGPCFLRSGRHDPHAARYGLWWSGSGLVFRADCARIEVEAESSARDHAPWLGVIIDGAPAARFPLMRGKHRYPALEGMERGVWHEITLLRDTQPSYDEDGPVYLDAVYADGEIEKPAEKPYLIEFIGDSLTVGEGTLGPVSAQEWRMPFISHMPAFPTLVAEALNAEKRLVALGGWGAYKSWDCNHDSRIGRIYGQLCGVTPGGDTPYGFEERGADAVVINLGTNDQSALSKAPAEQRAEEEENLIRDAVLLLKTVRAHQPDAVILWAYGLCGAALAPVLERAVIRYRLISGDAHARFLPLPDAAGDVGSRSHPGRRAHERAAETIIGALRGALEEKKNP